MDEHEWTCPRDTPGTPGAFLRGLRRQLRLTQDEAAAKAGVDRTLIAKIEGERDVRVGTLTKVVEALGGRLVLSVRTARALKDMAEDHVEARQAAWQARSRIHDGNVTSRLSTRSPS